MNKTSVQRTVPRQRGFFTVGVGLGLAALFSLLGIALEPDQTIDDTIAEEVIQNSIEAGKISGHDSPVDAESSVL